MTAEAFGSCAVLGQLRAAITAAAAGASGGSGRDFTGGEDRRGASRRSGGHWGDGRRRGAGHWGGGQWGGSQWGDGFAGPSSAWWPGPPSAPEPRAGRGDVRAAILALLREGPRTGYQIMSEIAERSHGAWRPSPGAVYPALSQLADEGLIAAEKSGGRRIFGLTDAGREYVAANPEMARGAWESIKQQEAWQVPGLFAEAARLGRGIVQLAHAGTAAQLEVAERLLARTRREIYQILADDGTTAGDAEQDN